MFRFIASTMSGYTQFSSTWGSKGTLWSCLIPLCGFMNDHEFGLQTKNLEKFYLAQAGKIGHCGKVQDRSHQTPWF